MHVLYHIKHLRSCSLWLVVVVVVRELVQIRTLVLPQILLFGHAQLRFTAVFECGLDVHAFEVYVHVWKTNLNVV